jgi:hypothetical protein
MTAGRRLFAIFLILINGGASAKLRAEEEFFKFFRHPP